MVKIQYLDFDIRIEKRENGYRSLVLNSPAGQAAADFQLPSLAADLDSLVRQLGHIRGGVRRLESPESEAARKFGASLFGAVFSDNVRACFESARASLSEGTGLRLRLRLSDVPELADVPWEFLYDSGADRFLVLSIETPLVRYIDLPRVAQPLHIQPPLDVLVMIACPSNYHPLDVDREWEKLKQALGDIEQRGLIRLHRLESATLSGLHHALRRQSYHIFHFIGHGIFDEKAQDGILLFENESGRGRPVTGQELGTLFYDYRSSLRLAVLNACEGARTSTTDPFAGAAQSLVQKGIPAVIAMQFEITDEAAIALAHEFYGAMAEGYPVDAALAEARKAIYTKSREIGTNIEWGTPVLYMRSPDGFIFDVQLPVAASETLPSVALSTAAEERLSRLYDDGLEAYVLGEWAKACQAFEDVINVDPNYQDAAARLEECRKKNELVSLRSRASQALESENWRDAVQLLEGYVAVEPGDREVESMLVSGRKQLQISELYSQARRLHRSEKWEAAVKVFDQIRAIDPQSPDPENLYQSAQAALAEVQKQLKLEQTYNQALREVAAKNWENAHQLLGEVQAIQKEYREAERLSQMVATQLKEAAEYKQIQEQVARLYGQANEYFKSRRWEKALESLAQIGKLDPAFPDPQGIASRAQAELDASRLKAETQKRVIALYADAQRMLVDGQAAQALACLDEIRSIAPGFPDRQGIRKKASLALKGQRRPVEIFVPQEEIASEVQPSERIGWMALGIGLGWAIVRLAVEGVPRILHLISSSPTFLEVLIISEFYGMGNALVLWAALHLKGVRLPKISLVLLVAGFLAGQFFLSILGTVPPFIQIFPYNWHIGLALAGSIAGIFTSWALRRAGLDIKLIKAAKITAGFAIAFVVSNLSMSFFLAAWSIDINSLWGGAMSVGSFVAGLLCSWMLFAQITDDNGHEIKAF
jgi:tetratricopeptide (TPR) repeat protein